MTALPDVGLLAAQVTVGAVSVLGDVVGLPVCAVVAGEDDQRIIGQFAVVEFLQNLADTPIDLRCEIAVRAGFALALEFSRRQPRGMWR